MTNIIKKTIISLCSVLFISSNANATDNNYGLAIDDNSNVSMMTIDKSQIRSDTACNPNYNGVNNAFTYYDGTLDSSNSSWIGFEIANVNGNSAACYTDLTNLISKYNLSVCNVSSGGCGLESSYAGIVTFNGTIAGANEYDGYMYDFSQFCAVRDDLLQEADCYITQTSFPTNGSANALSFGQSGNSSLFYTCIGPNCTYATQPPPVDVGAAEIQAGGTLVTVIVGLILTLLFA
ncbi:MAG: hypothetical protein K2Y14_10725 [Burkholderiales bacterium]|nr:hypothetical protein [Burkholderiales bacterium]